MDNETAEKKIGTNLERDSRIFTLSGILTGFSVAGVLALLPNPYDDVPKIVVFTALLIASMAFLLTTFNAFIYMQRATDGIVEIYEGEISKRLYPKTQGHLYHGSFIIGWLATLVSLGATGFSLAVWMGLVTSIVVFLGFVAIIYANVAYIQSLGSNDQHDTA